MTFIPSAPYPRMFPGKERWHVNEEILDFSPYIAFSCISLTNVFLIVKMYREQVKENLGQVKMKKVSEIFVRVVAHVHTRPQFKPPNKSLVL